MKRRIRVSSNGVEVMHASKWFPANAEMVRNVIVMLKEGLPVKHPHSLVEDSNA